MNRVLDRLYIGAAVDLAAPLSVLGFTAVLDLRDGEVAAPFGVETHRIANRDGDPWTAAEVEEALAFVHDRLRRGKVLIACAAGMSRSASIVVGYLVRCGWSFPEAFARVRVARPEIAPVQKMLAAVRAVVG